MRRGANSTAGSGARGGPTRSAARSSEGRPRAGRSLRAGLTSPGAVPPPWAVGASPAASSGLRVHAPVSSHAAPSRPPDSQPCALVLRPRRAGLRPRPPLCPVVASSGAPVAAVAAVAVVLGGDARVQAGGGLSSSGPARAQVPRAAPSPPRCGSAPPDDSRETSTRLALDVLRPRASFLWHRGACREQPFRCKFKLIYLPSVRLTGFCI